MHDIRERSLSATRKGKGTSRRRLVGSAQRQPQQATSSSAVQILLPLRSPKSLKARSHVISYYLRRGQLQMTVKKLSVPQEKQEAHRAMRLVRVQRNVTTKEDRHIMSYSKQSLQCKELCLFSSISILSSPLCDLQPHMPETMIVPTASLLCTFTRVNAMSKLGRLAKV